MLLIIVIVGFAALQVYLHIDMKNFKEGLKETRTVPKLAPYKRNAANTNNTSTEKSITDTTPMTKNTEPTQTSVQNAETADVPVSPYGFGPYPEIPEDYPTRHLVKWPRRNAQAELLSRVLIKLWTEGEKNFYGGSTGNGKIYPHYNDAVYVRFAEYQRPHTGEIVRYPSLVKSGPHVNFTNADILNPPPHLRILDYDSSGIEPYQYLNLPLPYQKGEK